MYRRESKAIPAGGLNLLLPNDALESKDSIALHNWRVDAGGVLRTRLNYSALSPAQPNAGYCHTIFRMGNERFYGTSTYLYKGASLLASGFEWDTTDPRPLSMAAYQGYLWCMNRLKQGRYQVSSGTFDSWLPAAPGAPSLADSSVGSNELVEGFEYSYWVTWQTFDGQETNPNDPQVKITVGAGNNTVTITRPTSTDSRITVAGKWNVYRIGNTLQNAYRVNQDPIPYSASTFVDTGRDFYSDTEVTRLGIELPQDHDDPPAAAGIAGPYYERLLAFNSAANPNRLWWTDALRPHYWPGSALVEGNHVDVGEEADPIVAVTLHPGHARIYKKRSVWRLRGNPDDGVLERTNAESGLIGARAIDSVGGLDYFQTQEGIAVSNGDTIKKLSTKLDPIFLSNALLHDNGSYPTQAMNGDEAIRALHCLAVKNKRLYFSYAEGSSSVPNQMVCLHLDTGDAVTQKFTGYDAFTALYYEGQYSELVGTLDASAGKAAALEYNDGSTIDVLWCSGYHNQGVRDRQKTYSDLVIEHSTLWGAPSNETLTVKAKFDAGTTADAALGSIVIASTAASGPDRQRTTFKILTGSELGRTARDIAIRVEGSTTHDVVIYGADIHYFMEPRDALSFDSDETDCGEPRVKEFETIEVEIDATGTVSYDFRTDLPGGVLATRQTATIPATSGRQVVPITVALPVGKLMRFTLTATATFRLYAIRVKARPLPVYRDGAAGESWQPPAMAA